MADITYVIGAKDSASPVLNKVDGAMSRLERSTKELGENAERSLGRISIGIGSLVKASGVLFVLDKAVQGVAAAFAFVGDSVGGVRDAEAAAQALSSAMMATGQATDEMVAANIRLADSLEEKLGVESESIQNLMTMAANLGTPVDQLDEVARASVGLSEALGISLEDALKKTREASTGSFGELEKLIPAMQQMATDEEKLAAVMAVASRGIDQQAESYNGTAGAMARAGKAVADFGETIAAAVMPVIDSATNALSGIAVALTDVFGGALESSSDMIASWQEFLSEKITTAANAVIGAITMAEVIVLNFGEVWELIKSTIALKIETMSADIGHFFGTVLPAYGSWFVENFPRFFEDAFNAITTIVQNGAAKVAAGFEKLWEFVKNRGKGGLSGLGDSLSQAMSGSLLEGFESTVASLPDIAARSLTEREKSLQAKIGGIGAGLAGEFAEKFNERSIKVGEKVGENLSEGINLQLNKTAEEAQKEVGEKLGLALGTPAERKQGGGASDAMLTAFEGRMLTRGPAERKKDPSDYLAEILSTTKVQSAAIMEMASDMEQVKNQLQNNPVVVAPNP